MSPNHNFTSLRTMPAATLDVKISAAKKVSNTCQWTIRLTNNSQQLAFFINPQLVSGGEEVLPSYWSDNYFSIPAGDNKTITVSCALNEIKNAVAALKIEGWNIKEQMQLLSLPVNIGSH